MSALQYGCECPDCVQSSTHPHGAENAPVVLVVERRGRRLRVCSRCYVPRTDRPIARLIGEVVTDDDAATLILHHGSRGVILDCRIPWARTDLPSESD